MLFQNIFWNILCENSFACVVSRFLFTCRFLPFIIRAKETILTTDVNTIRVYIILPEKKTTKNKKVTIHGASADNSSLKRQYLLKLYKHDRKESFMQRTWKSLEWEARIFCKACFIRFYANLYWIKYSSDLSFDLRPSSVVPMFFLQLVQLDKRSTWGSIWQNNMKSSLIFI